MCDDCLMVNILPCHRPLIESLIRKSGRMLGASVEQVETNCQLFNLTLCAYYIPPNVKRMLIDAHNYGIPVFDRRYN